MLIAKVIAVFLISWSVGVLYRIPRKLLLYASLVGVISWLVMYSITYCWGNVIVGDFFASISIGFLAEGFARLFKKPATVFIIPGFIPLVPGGEAYYTMLYMVEGHYFDGVSMGMKTMLIGGAIAFGIFVSSTSSRLFINYKMESISNNAEKS